MIKKIYTIDINSLNIITSHIITSVILPGEIIVNIIKFITETDNEKCLHFFLHLEILRTPRTLFSALSFEYFMLLQMKNSRRLVIFWRIIEN